MPTPNFDTMTKTELEAYVANSSTTPSNAAKAQAELDQIQSWTDTLNAMLPTGRTLGELIGMYAQGPRRHRGFDTPPPPPLS